MPFTPSRRLSTAAVAISAITVLAIAVHVRPQAQGRGQAPPPSTLGLQNGTLDFDTPDFTLKLVKDSQTIAALQPKGAKRMDPNTPFDFTPADQLTARQGDGFNHLGDITLRVKQAGWQDGAWVDVSSSDVRKPVTAISAANAKARTESRSTGAAGVCSATANASRSGTLQKRHAQSCRAQRATDVGLPRLLPQRAGSVGSPFADQSLQEPT